MMQRRTFIQLFAAASLAVCLAPMRVFAAVWNKTLFDAVGIDEALQLMDIKQSQPSNDVLLVAPDRAENGAIVQIEVTSQIPNTESIDVLVDRNPTALIGHYEFKNGAQPFFVTRIKMAETSEIRVLAKVNGQYFTASKTVEVLENGCGGSSANEKFEPSMKLRAKNNGDMTEVKAIIIHPMHTGHGKDDAGQVIPAHFIQTAKVSLNGKPVLELLLGTGISRNPYLTFKLKGAKIGDKIGVTWTDNLGLSGSGETDVISA
jgi:thiosulfate oxidation carrier protein SoxY/thiosulfate oxidation carrier complex protein SoxZ